MNFRFNKKEPINATTGQLYPFKKASQRDRYTGYSIDTHPESGDKWARFTVTNLYCFRVTLIKKFIDYSNTGIYRIFISAAKVLKLGRFLSSSTSYGMLR